MAGRTAPRARARRENGGLWVRAVLVGLAGPSLATVVALLIPHAGATSAASLYILSVAAAAAVGRLPGGLVAAATGFLGLNFFFTPPRHTLKVRGVDDAIALTVFLVVAVLVAALLDRATRERARAERREREARSLHRVASAFLSPLPLERVVADLAATLAEMLALQACRIDAVIGDRIIEVRHPPAAAARTGSPPEQELRQGDDEHRLELPLSTASRSFGTLTLDGGPHGWPPSDEELALARAVAGQIAAALERTELDEEIERARVRAEASATRAALFSSVTHDLRTPLASIKAGVTSLLGDGANFDEYQRTELLRTTLEETDRLNSLVGNLLDLARLRAGALVPARVPVDIEDLIGSVVNRLRSVLAGHTIRTMFRPDLPAVPMDPTPMDQALTNILENAARFSPPGAEITVSASLWQSMLEVRIADRGPGIPPEERERVFEEFYRNDRETGRGGTGLGLAIARAIVEAHGGKIWAEGAPDGGAAIVLRLPTRPAGWSAR